MSVKVQLKKIVEQGCVKQLGYVVVDSPAVATDLAFDWVLREYVEVIGFSFRLVTDANVADRLPAVRLSTTRPDGSAADQLFELGVPVKQVASVDRWYNYFPSNGISSGVSSGSYLVNMMPLPEIVYFVPQIDVVVANMQAGDQISDIRVYFKQHVDVRR